MKQLLTIWWLLLSYHSGAQVHCFAEIALDRNSVYVQQPFKVTITVLTATWYTEPLQFDNLQIPNAFTLPFNQTSPGMFDVKGKQYAGLQFYFIVFPYQAGNFTLPPLHLVATTPPEGSAVATKVSISTPARTFTVKPVPAQFKSTNWLVAKNVFISQHWNKPLQQLKVGDVIERTVTISARGTLPQFIPNLSPENLSFANTYLQDAELEDDRNDYGANGRLTQSITYLLEKEGDFELPPVEINWWNPLNSRRYQKTIPAVRIRVAANPHLGMMATLQDSLAAIHAKTVIKQGKKGPYTIAGIAWYWFTLYTTGLLLMAVLLFSLVRRLIRWYIARRTRYVKSEPFYFRRLRYLSASPKELIHHFYPWWDRVAHRQRQPAATRAWRAARQQDLLQQWKHLNAYVFNGGHQQPERTAIDLKTFKITLTYYRKNKGADINPTAQRIDDNQQLWPPTTKARL